MTHRRRSPCCIDEAERFVRAFYGLPVDAAVLPSPEPVSRYEHTDRPLVHVDRQVENDYGSMAEMRRVHVETCPVCQPLQAKFGIEQPQ